jgi:VCBS repeat-containing protein
MTISWILKPRFNFKLITLLVALQISACSTEDFANADNIASETSFTAETTNTPNTTADNQAAVITGDDNGRVTEDLDSNNDGLLGASGKLNISDSDAGEAAFITTTVNSNYGSLNITIDGNWFYGANNNLTAIQNLNGTETLTDRLTISSFDGTTHDIVITIYGVDEPGSSAPTPTEPAPTEPEPTEPTPTEPEPTNPVPTEPGPTADINLSWIAPSEREDNEPILLSEISGYKIYYGTTQGNYNNSVSINEGSAVSYVFNEFSSGTYYFVITTLDTDGRESQYSSAIQIVI